MCNKIENIINFLKIEGQDNLLDYYQDIQNDIGKELFNKHFIVIPFSESIINALHGIDKDEVITILTSLIHSSWSESLLHSYHDYCMYEKISILDTDYPLSAELLIQMCKNQNNK